MASSVSAIACLVLVDDKTIVVTERECEGILAIGRALETFLQTFCARRDGRE